MRISKQYRYARRSSRKARFSTRNVGNPPGTQLAKSVTKGDTGMFGTRTLVFNNVTDITRGTGLSERTRDFVNLRGFALHFNAITNTTAPNVSCFNVAFLAPKAGKTISNTDFFRSQSSGDDRDLNFSIALTGEQLHMLPINTDKYTVLKHKRFKLTTQSSGVSGFYRCLKMWVPLRRQIAYDASTGLSATEPVYFCWWMDLLNAPANQTVTANTVNLQWKVITFFRDANL